MAADDKTNGSSPVSEYRPTNRERELIGILTENPMISQADIAERMGITRSSVSVYITNLIKNGVIKGRGYILEKAKYAVVIGSANFDYIGTAENYHPSGPAHTIIGENANLHVSYAGFAKIVPEILSRMEYSAIPVCAVGGDIFGNELLKEMKANDIDTQNAVVFEDASTSMYMELRDASTGNVLARLTNMKIIEKLTPQLLADRHRVLQNAGAFAVADDLSIDTVSYLTMRYPTVPVFFMTNDAESTARFESLLPRLHLMVLSLPAACATAGKDMSSGDLSGSDAVSLAAGVDGISGNAAGSDAVSHADESGGISGSMDDRQIAEIAMGVLEKGAGSVLIPFSAEKMCYAAGGACYIITDHSDGQPAFFYNVIRMPVMAAAIYCESLNSSLLDKLNFIAAARSVAARTHTVDNYQAHAVGITAIQEELKKGNYSIQTIYL